MPLNYLEFEKPIAEFDEKIRELERVNQSADIDLSEEIATLKKKSADLTEQIFAKLDAWQITQLARHPLRPYTLDYIDQIITGFQQLHGDRMYADDKAIVAGFGYLGEQRVCVIGHQKGRSMQERTERNFGMPRPEGYRKAQRIMKLAERFKLPIITLIDTAGAYPGVGAEERGQSEAIASSLQLMTTLKVPVLAVVIGEGGSGGALAIGVCDRLLMLEYATYSVISPEGCASILWKSADKAPDAAEAMGMTTTVLSKAGLVDEVVSEPKGGAHRDATLMAATLQQSLQDNMAALQALSVDELLEKRYERLLSIGNFEEKSA